MSFFGLRVDKLARDLRKLLREQRTGGLTCVLADAGAKVVECLFTLCDLAAQFVEPPVEPSRELLRVDQFGVEPTLEVRLRNGIGDSRCLLGLRGSDLDDDGSRAILDENRCGGRQAVFDKARVAFAGELWIWTEVIPELLLPISNGLPEGRSIGNGEVRVELGILIEPQLLDDIVQHRLREDRIQLAVYG